MTNPPPFVRLPLAFDAAALLADVADLKSDAWVSHFNAGYHNGGWSGVALRSGDGDSARLYVEPGATEDPKDTALLTGRTALGDALASFDCRLRSARLLRLAPGGTIDLHHDADLRFDTGQARMHVVLATNDAVEFYVDGERVIMAPGECWYLDLSRPHRVANRGSTDRIHLVVDAVVNDWLIAQIAAGDAPRRTATQASGAEEFERFRQIVFERPSLGARLRETTQTDAFVSLAVTLGKDAGCEFAATDVNAAMAQGRHRWIAQWVV